MLAYVVTLRSFRRLALVALVGLVSAGAVAEVPPRSEGGQTLEVPEAHLDLGQVYYLLRGDTQVALSSETRLARIVLTSGRAVGYVVSPFDLEDAEVPLLAGAVRLPVVSLGTGSGRSDRNIRALDLLGAATQPEITFEMTGVRDLVTEAVEEDVFKYRLTVVGKLGGRGIAKEVVVPVEMTVQLATWNAMSRTMGDMVILKGNFEVKPGDFGWQPEEGVEIAETFRADLFLVFSTVSPDKRRDPRIRQQQWTKELRFLTLLRDLDDPEAGYDYGRAYLREVWDDVGALARMASTVVDQPDIRRRDLGFAMQAARRANELSEGKEGGILATMAQIYYEMGDLAAAVEWQKKAVDQLGEDAPDSARAILESYQGEAKKSADIAPRPDP
ncbi:MAG: YceI family protein [bacterium]|nr:YceI family protein [bacterium]